VVEKVIAHKFVKGRLVFDVKWQGYDDPKDRTWEPEENMEGAIDVMQEYFDEIGGRPEAPGQKRKARASASSKPESGTQALAKRVKQEKEWSPPPGSWEHDVKFVDTIEESTDPRTGELGRFAYLVWNNDKKTQHPLKHVNLKCPQKVGRVMTVYRNLLISPDAPILRIAPCLHPERQCEWKWCKLNTANIGLH
jgi:chromobox protein 1